MIVSDRSSLRRWRARNGLSRPPAPGASAGRLCIIAAVAILTACERQATPSATPEDSWYRAVDSPVHEFITLPPFLFSPVKAELVTEAVIALGDGPLLQLSPSEAVRYADDRLRTMRELRPFLIHGLYRRERRFNVAIADRALWVDSADAADDRAPVKRQPLVIYIDEVPPDVYVTVGDTRSTVDPAAIP